jgi:hypothetical protein
MPARFSTKYYGSEIKSNAEFVGVEDCLGNPGML